VLLGISITPPFFFLLSPSNSVIHQIFDNLYRFPDSADRLVLFEFEEMVDKLFDTFRDMNVALDRCSFTVESFQQRLSGWQLLASVEDPSNVDYTYISDGNPYFDTKFDIVNQSFFVELLLDFDGTLDDTFQTILYFGAFGFRMVVLQDVEDNDGVPCKFENVTPRFHDNLAQLVEITVYKESNLF